MLMLFLTFVLSFSMSTADAQVECSFRAPVWQVCSGSNAKEIVPADTVSPTPPGGGDTGAGEGGPGNGGGDHGKGKGHDHDGKGHDGKGKKR